MQKHTFAAMAATALLAACAGPGPITIGGCTLAAGAACPNVNLAGAKLERQVLNGINLKGANLQGANFDSASLRNADLSGANLQGAYLASADLQGARLEGANLSGAQWLERRDGYGTVIAKTCAAGSIGTCR